MELRDYIEDGIKKAGTGRELARILGTGATELADAKAHRRSLPLDVAMKLADYIEANLRTVLAVNALVTEKKEEKRAYWRPFVEHAKGGNVGTMRAIFWRHIFFDTYHRTSLTLRTAHPKTK